jgi:enoyl-CoA hydratase/carnithine racemase
MSYEKIIYDVNEGRATATINRPEVYNAFDYPTLRELADAFRKAADDDGVGVLVLTGAGAKAFCTGADLKEQEQFLSHPRDYFKWFGAFQDAHDQLRWIGKPTIARLNGMVVGGGNEFNMSCDLAIAADHVTIRQIGNTRGSVAAGGATQWLPLFVGERRAREILWLNEEIPAQQALEWGLVNQVVPGERLDAAVDQLVQKLLRKMPDVMRYTKTQTNFWKEFSWSMTVMHARDWLAVHADSAEVEEGLRSFLEKRPVDYVRLRGPMAPAGSPEMPWGDYGRNCLHCGATRIPANFTYCGNCGKAL